MTLHKNRCILTKERIAEKLLTSDFIHLTFPEVIFLHSLIDLKQFDFHLISVRCDNAYVGHYRKVPRTHYEMVYKIDGRSTQFFDTCQIELIPDSIYLIPRFQDNSYTVTEPGRVINIFFNVQDDTAYTDLMPELIVLSTEKRDRYKTQFLKAATAWSERSPASYFHTHAIVSGIFADLVADRERQYLQSSKYHHILPAVDYIRQNFRSPISVTMLTELCGISDEYLRTLFRSYTGQTPLEYIQTLRLSYARELLISGQIGVAQAAAESGFENPGYFSRLFKKRYNVSPSRINELKFDDPYKEGKR